MSTPQSGNPQHTPPSDKAVALLGALCLFLSLIEYLIPKPLPFMRIGLANLPLLLAVTMLGPRDFFLLAFIKVLGQGVIGGTLFSYVFLLSLAGTFASAALMFVLRRLWGKNLIGFAGLGCAGALASNAVQLVLARYFIFGMYAQNAHALRYLIPPFLASGFVAGIALGIFCEYFCRHSVWYANINHGVHGVTRSFNNISFSSSVEPRDLRSKSWNALFRADELFVAGLGMALIFLFGRSLPARIVQFLFFCLLGFLSGKKNKLFLTIMVMASIVFFNVLSPYGKVLVVIGPLSITEGSLLRGLEKALTFTGLFMLSRACIKNDLKLPGKLGALLGESLRMFELMRAKKSAIRRGRILGGIDDLLLEMEKTDTGEPEPAACAPPKRNVMSLALLAAMVLLTAAAGLIRFV